MINCLDGIEFMSTEQRNTGIGHNSIPGSTEQFVTLAQFTDLSIA